MSHRPFLVNNELHYESSRFNITKALDDVCEDTPTVVEILGTHKLFSKKRRSVKIRFLRYETIRKSTHISLDNQKKMFYMNFQYPSKIAALYVLNSFLKIKLFYPILWRWYFYVRQYKQEQLYPIIAEGAKKNFRR